MSASNDTSLMDWVKSLPLYPLPHHLLSRAVYWLTRQESRFTPWAIRQFVRAFNVDMQDAVNPDINSFKSFNAFFTRAIKSDARPIVSGEYELACPADGRISAIGKISQGQIIQAKNHDYSVLSLLAGDTQAADRLQNGLFTTVYLSPRDYHRLHMPLTGRLLSQTHVPGRLFSVGPHTVRTIPNLFARNERVIAQFETETGLMALVLVGAINVAAIETVWHGLVTPPQRKAVSRIDYSDNPDLTLQRGEEMGRFNMGSTIIVLLEGKPNSNWRIDMPPGTAVRMGQYMGSV